MDGVDSVIADQHYYTHYDSCTSYSKCLFHESLAIALNFAKENEFWRINIVRCMLLTLAAPSGQDSELIRWFKYYRERARDVEEQHDTPRTRSTVKYAILGHELCLFGFLAIVQLPKNTVQCHAADVTSLMSI
eukprot:IDg23448t1